MTQERFAVRQERSGWRDENISRRHRDWGWDVPAVDIDFLEYDHETPISIIEYKQRNLRTDVSLKLNSGMRALSKLADMAKIPFFAVFYMDNLAYFRIFAVNSLAHEVDIPRQILSEKEYVSWLYTLRGRPIPSNISKQLKG